MIRICNQCKKDITKRHFNSKYCKECALSLKKRPLHNLDSDQIKLLEEFAGVIPREDLPELIGSSLSSIRRWARDEGVSLATTIYSQAIKDMVVNYYERFGKEKTQKAFPDVNVRSIIERCPHKPRQIKWLDYQIIDAVKMGPFLDFKKQSKIFNRPNANAGSIRSLWAKVLHSSPTTIHGLPKYKAKYFINVSECPSYKLPVLYSGDNLKNTRILYLWSDMSKHFLPSCPDWFKTAVDCLSDFQGKIYGKDFFDSKTKLSRIILKQMAKLRCV